VALQDVVLWLFVTRDEADAWAGLRIIPKISQETLAEIIGTTRPRRNTLTCWWLRPSRLTAPAGKLCIIYLLPRATLSAWSQALRRVTVQASASWCVVNRNGDANIDPH
jgi:hypothetical protein